MIKDLHMWLLAIFAALFLNQYAHAEVLVTHLFEIDRQNPVYQDALYTLKRATANDQVFVHINSPGGEIGAMDTFMRALTDSKGEVHCVLGDNSMAASAAAVILMVCPIKHVDNSAQIMFHTVRRIDQNGQAVRVPRHMERSFNVLVIRLTRNILTPREIKAILRFEDVWLSGAEFNKRLRNVQ